MPRMPRMFCSCLARLPRMPRNGSHASLARILYTHFYLKAGFHMIADRRSQIAIRSAIVCDHMETTSAIVCDPAIVMHY